MPEVIIAIYVIGACGTAAVTFALMKEDGHGDNPNDELSELMIDGFIIVLCGVFWPVTVPMFVAGRLLR